MNFDTAKNILEKEIANIADEELSEALYTVIKNSIPKKRLNRYISNELAMVEENTSLDSHTLNGMKAAYLAIKNIFLEEE